MEHTLHGFAARRNLASSGKSWLRRLSSDTGFRASRHFPEAKNERSRWL